MQKQENKIQYQNLDLKTINEIPTSVRLTRFINEKKSFVNNMNDKQQKNLVSYADLYLWFSLYRKNISNNGIYMTDLYNQYLIDIKPKFQMFLGKQQFSAGLKIWDSNLTFKKNYRGIKVYDNSKY